MKRRFLLIICIACLILSALVLPSCDGEKDDRIEIKIGFWPEKSQKSDVAMYEEWKANFERDYPQYKIVAEPYTYSPETVSAKGNQGQLPTIFQTYFTEPDMLIREGYIRPITEQITALGWIDKMDDSMRAALTRDGELYGVPRDGYGMGLYLNLAMMYDCGIIEKDADGKYIIYDEEGKPLYPTTFDEVTDVCRIVSDTYNGEKYGIIILSANKTGGWQLCNIAWNFGAGALQTQGADGKWTSNLMDEGMVKALTWIQSLANEGLLYPSASFNYNDWAPQIGTGNVCMAFVGNDALGQPITAYGFNKDDFALVPMPTGDGTSHAALFGGTPYVFAENATDEQVEGALLFLKYIGRSPEVDEISVSAMEKGHQVAQSKAMPILPTIKAWKNEDYLEIANALEEKYVNVNYEYMKDFFDTIYEYRHDEEPNYCQDMYGLLDLAIQNVITNPNADPRSLLTTANNNFMDRFLSKLK